MNLKEIMLYIKHLLESNKIRYIMDCGTLLKAYRQKLLDIEDDQDFAIYKDDLEKVKTLIVNDPILKPILTIKAIWENEISVFIKGSDNGAFGGKHQIDFYRYDYDIYNCYHYWYAKNPISQIWDVPYRIVFPTNVYFPLKTMEFLGENFTVPNNPEKKFEYHYGPNWRTPKKEFYGIQSIPNVDKVWKNDPSRIVPKVGVMMTTFLRDNIIMKTMKHYLNFPYKMYIIDQGHPNTIKDQFYNEMRAKGHVIQYAPYDCGLSYARNMGIKLVKEPYVIIHDDDQIINTDVDTQVKLLESSPYLGIVGGQMWNSTLNKVQIYSYNMKIQNKILYYSKVSHGYCDIVLNFFVAKTELFRHITWDNSLKLTEHTDFFLRLKSLMWKVYYDSNFIGEHFPERTTQYDKLRSRPEFFTIFKRKHNIIQIIGNN